jgi:hypothetical protein
MKRISLLVVTVTLFMAACGPKIYKSDNFGAALARHKTVAILPAEVTIQLRPNEAKKVTAQDMNDMQTKSAYDIQDKMYGWFLRRSDKFHYTVTFQDINKTNAKLKDAGIAYEDLRSKDRGDLARILGVDAVMQGKTVSEKPMSEGAAVAVGVIFGAWGSTNKVQTAINIHDGKSGELLWKYDYEASGSIGSSTTRLVDALMKNATKKFPYSAK